jgi:serine/threonine protein kinase
LRWTHNKKNWTMRGLFKLTKPEKPLGGRYKIISELGAGGFGQTFLAQDLHLPDNPECVVKQLKPQLTDAQSLQTARRLFDIEARVLYQLGNHDQIPRLLAHFEDNQEFYLAQELIDGEPLSREMAGGQCWTESQAIAFLQDLLNVLAFVHEQNVIHRDLKPSNLMRRRRDSKIVLIDFGAVKQVSTQITSPKGGHTKTISIGTQGYTPKEQLGGNPRFSSDVYAAGIITIQGLTGLHPRHLSEDSQTGEIRWRDRAPHISAELAALLDRMVRYDYRVRYPSGVEAREALLNLSASRTQSVPLSPSVSEEYGELPTQGWQPPATANGTTDSELGQASTHQWVAPETPTHPTTDSELGQASTHQWVAPETPTPPTTDSELGQAATHQRIPSESPTTDSELGQAATHQRIPSEIPAQSSFSNPSSTVPTVHSPHFSASTASTVVRPGTRPRKYFIIGSVLAILGATGSTLVLTKTSILSRQPANQIAERPGTPTSSGTNPAQSPTPSISDSPTPSPSSTAEPSTSPSPGSASTSNPDASPSDESTPSSPTSSPTPNSGNSAPASPVAKATPKSAPSPPPTRSAPPATSSAQQLLSQANRLREAKQYQKAVETYDQVIAVDGNIPEAHWGRCYSLNSVQQPNDAIAACNKALALKPKYAEALWSKGAALEQQQNPMAALTQYQQATALKPDFAEAWNNQGVALLKLNRPSDALNALERATQIQPQFANAWANRGAALWKLGRYEQAIASVEKAVKLQPDDPEIVNLRQQIQEKLGR